MRTLEALRPRRALWREDPIAFIENGLGCDTLWEKQIEIARAVWKHRRVAVAACHASSKTFTAARIAWAWLAAFGPTAKVVTTAPSARQVRDLLWAEIRSAYRGAPVPLGGDLLTMRWEASEDWFMTGFATSADRAQEHATKFQGYHSPHLLLIFDEAAGIAREIWDAADGLMTGQHAHHLAIGNPTDPTGEFAKAFRSPDWHTIRIDAHDMPHIRRREEHPYLASWSWVETMRRKWGESSPVYKAKVRGLFPDTADDTLISLQDVQLALARPALEYGAALADDGVRSIGVDVARFGSDLTCFYVVAGDRILFAESVSGQDTMATTGRTIALANRFGITKEQAHLIAIDDTGVGGGVTDRLREQGWQVDAENFGERATDSETFRDRRTELWWGMREWIRSAALADCPDDIGQELLGDLTTPKYQQISDGRIKLEAKADMKKRLGHSPDHGDALALALAWRTRTLAVAVSSEDVAPDEPRRWGFGLGRRSGR